MALREELQQRGRRFTPHWHERRANPEQQIDPPLRLPAHSSVPSMSYRLERKKLKKIMVMEQRECKAKQKNKKE